MSPEQVRGDLNAVDVRTDVYALGVLGYELLLGTLPYSAPWRELAAAALVICEKPPARPRAIERGFPEDLERILLTALAKDPSERYGSAAELAADLERFLSGQPVQAQPPSLAYQLRKLVRRHRLASTLAGALASLVVAGGLGMTALYLRAERLRAQAEAEHEQAEAWALELSEVVAFLDATFEAVDPELGLGPDLRLLDAVEHAASVIEARGGRTGPGAEASARRALGRAFLRLDRLERAEQQLERARALRLAGAGARPLARVEIELDVGRLRNAQGRSDEAVGIIEAALEAAGELLSPDRPEVAQMRVELASALRSAGDLQRASSELDAAVDSLRTLDPRAPELATALLMLGPIRRRLGHPEAAVSSTREGVELRRALHGEGHVRVAGAERQLASVLADTGGDREEVERLLHGVIAAYREHAPRGHRELAAALNLLAKIEDERGNLELAEGHHLEAIGVQRELVGEDHPEYAAILMNLGTVRMRLERPEEALVCFEEAARILERFHGADHPQRVIALLRLAYVHERLGDPEESARLAREVLAAAAAISELRETVSGAETVLAFQAFRRRDAEAGLEHAQKAVQALVDFGGRSSSDLAVAWKNLGYAFGLGSRHGEAAEAYGRAIELRRELHGARAPNLVADLSQGAASAMRAEDLPLAERWLREALSIELERAPMGGVALELRVGLGMILRRQGRRAEAEAELRSARDDAARALGEDHQVVRNAEQELERLEAEAGGLPR